MNAILLGWNAATKIKLIRELTFMLLLTFNPLIHILMQKIT